MNFTAPELGGSQQSGTPKHDSSKTVNDMVKELMETGIPEEKAREVAQSMQAYTNRLAKDAVKNIDLKKFAESYTQALSEESMKKIQAEVEAAVKKSMEDAMQNLLDMYEDNLASIKSGYFA